MNTNIEDFTMKCTYNQGIIVHDILIKNGYKWGRYNSKFIDKIKNVCSIVGYGYLILMEDDIFFVNDNFPDLKDDEEITYDYFIDNYTLKGQRKRKLQNLYDNK